MYARVVLQALLLGCCTSGCEGTDGRPKKHRVTCLIDEFPALGHLPFIENAMALAAGSASACSCPRPSPRSSGSTGTTRRSSTTAGTWSSRHVGQWVQVRDLELWDDDRADAGPAPQDRDHRPAEGNGEPEPPPGHEPADARLLTKDQALVLATVGARPVWLDKCRWWAMKHYRGRIRDTRWMEAA